MPRPEKKAPVVVKVTELDGVSLVAIENRRGRRISAVIRGVGDAPVGVGVDGNDAYYGAFSTVEAVQVEVDHVILYPSISFSG